ncbi:MAG: hypothetical protein O3A00_09525 [Planctomycetota bacterium]|nr:hypothetical protein [Planctomycetota bacterium]
MNRAAWKTHWQSQWHTLPVPPRRSLENALAKPVAHFASATLPLNARNVETCLLIDSTDNLLESLFDKQLTTKPIEFDDFEPGTTEEPEGEIGEAPPLKLASVILESATQVRVSYSHHLADEPTSLRLTIRGAGEERTRISVTLPNRMEAVETVTLPDNALADAHGTLLATLVADTAEGRRKSDPLWIIQPHRLTYGKKSKGSNLFVVVFWQWSSAMDFTVQ